MDRLLILKCGQDLDVDVAALTGSVELYKPQVDPPIVLLVNGMARLLKYRPQELKLGGSRQGVMRSSG